MGRAHVMSLVALAVLLAACGGDDGAEGLAIEIGDTSLGSALVDAEGMSLYLFVPDAQGESTCYDDCAAAWPPVTNEVVAGDGVDASLLGTVERTNGAVQATYNRWPLYYFANDAAAGDINGQRLNDVWFLIDAAGNAIP